MLSRSSMDAATSLLQAAAEAAPHDPATAALLLGQFAEAVLYARLASCRLGSMAPATQLAELRAADPETAALLEAVLLGPALEARIAAARRLAQHAASHASSFHWDDASQAARLRPLPKSLPVGGIITPV